MSIGAGFPGLRAWCREGKRSKAAAVAPCPAEFSTRTFPFVLEGAEAPADTAAVCWLLEDDSLESTVTLSVKVMILPVASVAPFFPPQETLFLCDNLPLSGIKVLEQQPMRSFPAELRRYSGRSGGAS